ncbi:F0F1 ATP synthase subunit B [Oricola sp.]|uniref:F0F1 ATP synthase subunit B n=1 Tax=Oricola sp. TaxID=1979950 RepID=UPI0025D642F6|nr:F0F1 ATP synthase subunit B [Oricola sp.]MCI5076658.1 F0F1 ATP synthase subunit B [Oricola sp.]
MFVTQAIAEEAAHGAAETAHAAADAHGGGAFPPFDSSTFASQLFWLALTFAFLYWFMSKVIVPRIGGILETRQDRIAQDLDKAHELKAEADEAIAAYEQELAQAKASANEIGNKARDTAKAAAEAERHKVEAKLAEQLAEAETRIASIRDQAMADVGSIANETTQAIVDRLIGAQVSEAEVQNALGGANG